MRVLVVDDEPKIRRGLAALIPQVDPDWRVCGEAKNGLEALDIVKKELPDLVITDIRMPHMNGLDLLSMLREYPVQVVILSGYGYFEYARTAIQFGAYDFLLKPVKPDEVKDVLARLKADRQARPHPTHSAVVQPNYGKLWEDWLTGQPDGDRYVDRLKNLLPPEADGFHLAVIEIDRFDELIKEDAWGDRQLVYFAVRNIVQEILAESSACAGQFLYAAGPRLHYLMTGGPPPRALIERMAREVRQCAKWSVSIAVSDGTDAFAALPDLYRNAMEALLGKWIFGPGTVRFYDDCPGEEALPGYPVELDEQMLTMIRTVNPEKAQDVLERFVETIRAAQMPFRLFRQYCLQLLSSVLRFVELHNLTASVFGQLPATNDLFHRIFSAEEYKAYMARIVTACIRSLELKEAHRRNRLLDKALAFMHENYHADLSLDDVAGHVGMGSSYFSTYFKQETGQSFVEYLTALRLDKAKQLMADPGLRLYEIAGLVGYNDVKYFSRVFKKVTGVTPAEYRQFFFS